MKLAVVVIWCYGWIVIVKEKIFVLKVTPRPHFSLSVSHASFWIFRFLFLLGRGGGGRVPLGCKPI